MAFLATAARIGWQAPSHDRVIDATGCSIDLTTIGGPLVKRKVIRDVQTALWQRLADDRIANLRQRVESLTRRVDTIIPEDE